jgi:hypothetical protein
LLLRPPNPPFSLLNSKLLVSISSLRSLFSNGSPSGDNWDIASSLRPGRIPVSAGNH